jgi:hypothetical protein
MNAFRLIAGLAGMIAAGAAWAGPTVPLGTPLGVALGEPLGVALGLALGAVLGIPLGSVVPIAASGVLVVAAVGLGLGIWIVRRKHRR